SSQAQDHIKFIQIWCCLFLHVPHNTHYILCLREHSKKLPAEESRCSHTRLQNAGYIYKTTIAAW
ncbi:unnamed protein product, partial [Tenebrio molitor]